MRERVIVCEKVFPKYYVNYQKGVKNASEEALFQGSDRALRAAAEQKRDPAIGVNDRRIDRRQPQDIVVLCQCILALAQRQRN